QTLDDDPGRRALELALDDLLVEAGDRVDEVVVLHADPLLAPVGAAHDEALLALGDARTAVQLDDVVRLGLRHDHNLAQVGEAARLPGVRTSPRSAVPWRHGSRAAP